MTTQLPLDDRATCAELFDYARTLAEILRALDPSHELLARFDALRAEIEEGEKA